MDYGKTITRAWQIAWQHKWLWWLGFLAALTGGGGGFGGGGGNSGVQFDGSSGELPFAPDSALGAFFRRLEAGDPGAIMGLLSGLAVVIALLCIIGIVLWFVGQAARAGLILAVDGIEDNNTEWRFGSAFRSGAGYLLPIFLFKLLLVIIPLLLAAIPVILFIGSIPAFVNEAAGFGTGLIVLACVSICLFVPLGLILQFIDAYGYRGLVLRKHGVVEAIRHGWQLFRDHLADSLILAVIVTVIGSVVGFVILLVLSPFIAMIAVPLIGYFDSSTLGTAGTVSIIVGALGLIVGGALLNSIVTTWRSAVFTLAYRDFTGRATPKTAAPMPPADIIGPEKTPDDLNKSNYL